MDGEASESLRQSLLPGLGSQGQPEAWLVCRLECKSLDIISTGVLNWEPDPSLLPSLH